MSRTSIRKVAFGSVAIGALSLVGAAQAQEVESAPAVDVIEVTEIAEAAEDESRQEKIVVTGSLLARDEFTSSSPIQVITAEVATLEGLIDTAELLQGSSLAAGSTQLNNTFQNFVTNGGVGTQTIDLRGCGDTRTLVLIDGKRPGPAGTRGAVSSVDLNTIPQSIISRVEILKDGASTIYGSDAICGVVNIITRDSVDGLELNLQYTQPEESGGEQFRASAAWGFEMGDNADFTLSAEYRRGEQLDISQRSYLECPQDLVRDPDTGQLIDRLNFSATATDPRVRCNNLYFNTVIDAFSGERLIPSPDGVTGPTAFGGIIPGYRPRVGTGVNPDGSLYYEDILDAPFVGNTDFIPENENLSFFATADIELGGVAWDTEFLYSSRTTDVEGWRQFFPLIGSANNPAGNNPAFGYIGAPTYSNSLNSLARPVLAFPSNADFEVDFTRLSSSLSGNFGTLIDGWSWKIDGTYSLGEGKYTNQRILNSLSSDWGIDGVADFTGDGVPDAVSAPVVDFLDPTFLSGARTDELVAAIGGQETGNTEYEQTTFTGVMAGELFSLPAGEVGLALGAEYRSFSIDDTPGPLTQIGDVWGSSVSQPTRGENSLTEIFGEIEVPILKGHAFAEQLDFNASARAFQYDIGGEDSIYKLGFNWQINPTFRLRSSYGTSYRAPALYELFLEDQLAFGSQENDPCTFINQTTNQNLINNCAAVGITLANINQVGNGSSAQIRTFGGQSTIAQELILDRFGQTVLDQYNAFTGGPDGLRSETGETFTAGFVFTPSFADLNIGIDYYEVLIEDQITQLSAGQVLGGCYGQPVFPNVFCNLQLRNPGTAPGTNAFRISEVIAPIINLDKQEQRGIDLEVRYEHDFNFATMTIDASVSWSLERVIDLFGADFDAGLVDNDFNGTIGFPSVVGDADIRFDRGDWTLFWAIDYVGRQDDNRFFTNDLNSPSNYFGLQGQYKVFTEAQFEHGLSLRWQGDTWTITGGINNLFDEEPPQVSDLVTTSAGNTPLQSTAYDIRGRRAFVNVSKTF